MAFLCPECLRPSLKILNCIELGADSRSDEIALQLLTCSRCDFHGVAVYEESRRGALGNDSFSHLGYFLQLDSWKALENLIAECPQPGRSSCDCEAHQALGKTNAWGRWIGAQDLGLDKSFELQIHNLM